MLSVHGEVLPFDNKAGEGPREESLFWGSAVTVTEHTITKMTRVCPSNPHPSPIQPPVASHQALTLSLG